MNNVYDEAHTLARALRESQEYLEYMDVKARVSANAELSEMINDFQAKRFESQAQLMFGGDGAEEIMGQVASLAEVLTKDPLAADYLQKEFVFMRLMADVNKIIGDVVQSGGSDEPEE